MKRKPTNVYLKELIENLKKTDGDVWKEVAKKLSVPRRKRIEVNLSHIDRHTEKNDTVVVPGKVLATGKLNKTVNIAAWRFSLTAKEKIKKYKSKCLTIEELVKTNPKGTGVKILT